MAHVIAGMTVSLDGFVADKDGSVERLYPDFDMLQGSDYMNGLIAETGAVLMGKQTFDMAGDPDSYADTYEFQVPIFVVTKNPPAIPPKQDGNLTFTFVTDGIEPAVAQATAGSMPSVTKVKVRFPSCFGGIAGGFFVTTKMGT